MSAIAKHIADVRLTVANARMAIDGGEVIDAFELLMEAQFIAGSVNAALDEASSTDLRAAEQVGEDLARVRARFVRALRQ